MVVRLPRWTWMLVLPLLAGALLLMHGLDSHAGDAHPVGDSAPSVVQVHSHDESTPGEHEHCLDCWAGHVVAACVAIITAVGGIGLGRRLLARIGLPTLATAVTGRVRGVAELARPPDPAWVRLSVMRC